MNCPRCGGPRSPARVRVRWPLVALVEMAGVLLAYWLTGDLLHDIVEGVQRSQLSLWKVGVPLAALLGGVLAAFARVRRPACTTCAVADPTWLCTPVRGAAEDVTAAVPGRRVVLRLVGAAGTAIGAVVAGAGAAVFRNRGWLPVANDFFKTKVETSAPVTRPEWQESRVRNYRRLGRTNAMVSDISLGSGRINDVGVARRAIERGITYFDTAPDYADTASERVLGEAMKGQRDKLFLATKFCVADGHLPNDTPVPKIIEAVDGSLRRLQTDRVDLIHIHACDRLDRLLAPNIHEAFDRLKEQGKVHFLGFSSHTPNLEEVANAAIDSGRFDVMMLAYHFGMWPNFGHILDKAKAHDVGVVAMKTLKGAKHANLADFQRDAGAYSQAAFRWVLSNPAVSCLVISISTHDQIDEYLYASGTLLRPTDVARLRRYDELIAGDYCQPHCGACLDACPAGLPINDILRYRMYFKDYGWEKEGMRRYAALGRTATVCASCPAPCVPTCPTGVPIRTKLLETHGLLSFRV